ncbi:MAG: GerAB/ArcD/ProY family transporter [Firmicutes bacterium]|nr:GerAB/ArcD/ProY family transporter [Bacillota bacterium]
MNEVINKRQLSILFFFILPITKLMLLPTLMSHVSGRDSYISTFILLSVDIFVLLLILFAINKYPKDNFNQILKSVFSKPVAKIILFLFGLFFLFKGLPFILEQKQLLENTFYERFPFIITFIIFFSLIFFVALKGAKIIGRTSELFWFIILISFILIIMFSFSQADFSNILPIAYNGAGPIFDGVLKNVYHFGDYIILFAFMGKIDKDKSFKKVVLVAGLIAALVVFVFVIFIAIFGDVAVRQTYAITKISKYSLAMSELGRFDFIAIIILLAGAVFFSAVTLYCSAEMFRQCFNLKERKYPLLALITILAAGTLFFNNRFSDLVNLNSVYMTYFYMAMQYLFPIILAMGVLAKENIFILRKNKEKV